MWEMFLADGLCIEYPDLRAPLNTPVNSTSAKKVCHQSIHRKGSFKKKLEHQNLRDLIENFSFNDDDFQPLRVGAVCIL